LSRSQKSGRFREKTKRGEGKGRSRSFPRYRRKKGGTTRLVLPPGERNLKDETASPTRMRRGKTKRTATTSHSKFPGERRAPPGREKNHLSFIARGEIERENKENTLLREGGGGDKRKRDAILASASGRGWEKIHSCFDDGEREKGRALHVFHRCKRRRRRGRRGSGHLRKKRERLHVSQRPFELGVKGKKRGKGREKREMHAYNSCVKEKKRAGKKRKEEGH